MSVGIHKINQINMNAKMDFFIQHQVDVKQNFPAKIQLGEEIILDYLFLSLF